MSEKPKITEDGGIVWERVPDEKGEPQREATSPDESQRREPEDATSSQEPQTSAPAAPPHRPVKKKRARWMLVTLAVLAALLLAWTAYDRLTATDGGDPPTVGESSTASGDDAREAEGIAVEYETAILAGQTEKACGYEEDPAACTRILGSAEPLATTEPPRVVQSGEVARPGEAGGEEETATAVLVEFTIEDQSNAQREVVFVRSSDGKVIGTEGVGSADAGKTLQALFEEAAS